MATTALTSSKTPGIIVSEIRMMSATFKGVHFLVEGDEDIRFWKNRVSRTNVSIVNCEGKPNLLGASALLQRVGLNSVSGVYDPDFERLFGVTHFPSFLTPTDENDLELTLMVSRALKAVLDEFTVEALVLDFEQRTGTSVLVHLEKLSRCFGELRILNSILGHRVDFDRLSPYRFVSIDTWQLDLAALHAEYAALAGIQVSDLGALIAQHCPDAADWQLSQGHDTLRILAHGLRRRIGGKQTNEQDLLKLVRLAYSLDLLQASGMYKALRTFEPALSAPIFDH